MVTQNADGSLMFRMYYPHAGSVELRGDFTPAGSPGIEMEREPEGWWRARARLAPGEYRFKYIVNGQSAMPDYAADGLAIEPDGSWVSCLHVRGEAEGGGGGKGGDEQQEAVRELCASLTEADLELLLSGRLVAVAVEGLRGTVLLSLDRPRARLGRGLPRPDRPAERRRDPARIDRLGERSRA